MSTISNPRSRACLLVGLIAAFFALNTGLNMTNKWALSHYGFSFPIVLTSAHMAFSFIVLTPFALKRQSSVHEQALAKQYKSILYIGCFMALNIALNNISLVGISLSLNQVIRSSMPVVTSILAIGVEGIVPSFREFIALLVLSIGVMIAVWQGVVTGHPQSIMLCCIATVCNAAMTTFSGKVLSQKMDAVRLTFYTAPISLACLAPFLAWKEFEAFKIYYAAKPGAALAILFATSVMAVLYNLVHVMVIKSTSGVTTTVIGEVKIVVLLVLSAVMLGEGRDYTLKLLVGCGMAITGFILYSHLKLVHSSIPLYTSKPIINLEKSSGST